MHTDPSTQQYDPAAILATADRIVATPERSAFVPAKVTAHKGCTEYTFNLRGGQWRLAGVSTYGNHSFVNGPGCDASGLVIRSMTVSDELYELLAEVS
jgi:hypothetical protein